MSSITCLDIINDIYESGLKEPEKLVKLEFLNKSVIAKWGG
jgi:hypothetical protein